MSKLWQGRTSGAVDAVVEQLNRSIAFDQRLYPYDIQGSIAHARMLGQQGIIPTEEAELIIHELQIILAELDSGKLAIDPEVEDIHTFVELELTRRIGAPGKKLHTGRSRNDQVALDLRLYLRDALHRILQAVDQLQKALYTQASQHQHTVMPGYTHLQPAQPVTFGMHLNAYIAMLERDKGRLQDCLKRLNYSPLGAGALAGSTFPLDRHAVAAALNFDGIIENPLDAVSCRDFALEALAAFA
jgi:argininosuccinate lyase